MSDIKTALISDINVKLSEYLKQGYHVPGVTVITERPDFMRPSLRIVEIDTVIAQGKTSNDEIYSVGGGKYAFGRIAIQKFADAGRIELSVLSTPVVKGKDVARYSASVSGERYELDGAPKRLTDEKTYDLCIREEEMKFKNTEKVEKDHPNWSAEQKSAFVEHGVRKVMIERQKFATEMAITGAQARVVTKMLGLKPAYTLGELKKPFVIVAMTPIVDMRDPDIKQMVTAHMLGIKELLYSAPRSTQYTSLPVETVELINVTENSSIAESKTESPTVVPASVVPSLSEFDDCPRGTKVRILQRILKDESVKAKLTGMDDSALFSLYEKRMAA